MKLFSNVNLCEALDVNKFRQVMLQCIRLLYIYVRRL